MDNRWRFLYHQGSLSDAGTQEEKLSTPLVERVQAQSVDVRQIRHPVSMMCDGEGNQVPKQPHSHCREKPLARSEVPVPQTDTGR